MTKSSIAARLAAGLLLPAVLLGSMSLAGCEAAPAAGTATSAPTSGLTTPVATTPATTAGTVPPGTDPLPLLYENPDYGVRVRETPGWSLYSADGTDPLRIVFESDGIQAILAVLPASLTDDRILSDLLRGLGAVEVLSREASFLDVRSTGGTPIRTIARIRRAGERAYLLVFVAPDEGIAARTDRMDALTENIVLSGQ